MADCYGNQVAATGESVGIVDSYDLNVNGTTSTSSVTMSKAQKFNDDVKKVCIYCYNVFRQKGCTDASAKGILANMYAESGIDYNSIIWDLNGISCGLIHFHWGGELNNLIAFYNIPVASIRILNQAIQINHKDAANYKFGDYISLEQQLGFIVENIFKRKKVIPILRMTNESLATRQWMLDVENPSKKSKNQDRWALYGNTIIKMLS